MRYVGSLFCVMVLSLLPCVIWSTVFHLAAGLSLDQYITVDLETLDCEQRSDVRVTSARPVLVRLGYSPMSNTSRMESCKMRLIGPEDDGLSLTVTAMNLYYRRSKCVDFIQFERKWHSNVNRALASISSSLFGDKSVKICRQNYEMDPEDASLVAVGRATNIFNSMLNEVKFKFSHGGSQHSSSFLVVVTVFSLHASACVDGQFSCHARDQTHYCINDTLVCDGVVNCAFSDSGGADERSCRPSVMHDNAGLYTRLFVWSLLAVCVCVLVCSVATAFLRCHRRQRHLVSGSTTNSQPQSRFSTLFSAFFPGPRYLATGASCAPVSVDVDDDSAAAALSPPSYDAVARDDKNALPSYGQLFPSASASAADDAAAVELREMKSSAAVRHDVATI